MPDDKDFEDAPAESRSGRVRIIGAEPAGHHAAPERGGQDAGRDPADGPVLFDQDPVEAEEETSYEEVWSDTSTWTSQSREPGDEPLFGGRHAHAASADQPGAGEPPAGEPPADESLFSRPAAGEPGLPHWTEAPTGEVPAVLARPTGEDDGTSDPWSAVPRPTWREDHTDWETQPDTFEPSMLGNDEAKLGSLDDSGEAERQPWSFDLPGQGLDDTDAGVWGAPAPEAGRLDMFNEDTVIIPAIHRQPAQGEVGYSGQAGSAEPTTGRGAVQDVDAGRGPLDADELLGPDPVPTHHRGRPGRRRGRSADRTVADPVTSTAAPARPAPKQPERRSRPRSSAPRPPEPPDQVSEAAGGRDLPVAIATGVLLGVVALIFFKLGTVTALLITTVIVVLAAAEGYAAFRKAGYQPATLLGLVATLSLMVATYNKGEAALPLVLVLVVAFTFLWYMTGVERGAEPVRGSAATLLVFCWVGVFGSFGALLLDPTLFPDRHGIAFLLGAVITTVACDIGALVVGSRLGRHTLAPTVSPNKTWEGLVGGAVASILGAVVIVHFIHPWTLGKAVVLGVVVAVVSPLGDLCESMVKRHLGLKDMGRMLPGHGGLLDRVDGMLFVLPATYFLVKALHLG